VEGRPFLDSSFSAVRWGGGSLKGETENRGLRAGNESRKGKKVKTE